MLEHIVNKRDAVTEYTYEGTCQCSTHYLTFGANREQHGNSKMPKCPSCGKKIKLDTTYETTFTEKKITGKVVVPNINKVINA